MSDPPERLRRRLRMLDVAALGLNGVIGTGIFFLPGKVAALMGPASLFPFLVSALLCSLLVLCFAEVSSRFRSTGGPMLYAEAAFGRTAGFAVGWLTWLTRTTSRGALANALFTATVTLLPAAQDHRIALLVGATVLLAGINVVGVGLGAGVTSFFTVAKLVPIVVLIAAGVFRIRGDLFVPFAPHGLGDLAPATLIILYAFVGFESLTVPAGEMRDPTRSVPRALILVMGTATGVYLLLWAVCTGTLPGLAGAESPVANAASVVFGPQGGAMIAFGILLSVIGVNAGSAVVAPRCLYALAERRYLPGVLAYVHPQTRTPVVAIVVTEGVSLALAISGSFVELAVLSIAARLVQYVATCSAMLWFRARRPEEPPRFRAPAGRIVAPLAILICGWLLAESDPRHLVWGAAAVLVGFALHLPMRRRAATAGDPRP